MFGCNPLKDVALPMFMPVNIADISESLQDNMKSVASTSFLR